jgi:hypothetical protein
MVAGSKELDEPSPDLGGGHRRDPWIVLVRGSRHRP